jgi:hypothetical protein
VHALDGLLSVSSVLHLDKGKALRAPRLPIHDQCHRFHRTDFTEEGVQPVFRRVVAQIAHVEFFSHDDYAPRSRTAMPPTCVLLIVGNLLRFQAPARQNVLAERELSQNIVGSNN